MTSKVNSGCSLAYLLSTSQGTKCMLEVQGSLELTANHARCVSFSLLCPFWVIFASESFLVHLELPLIREMV